MTEAHLLAAVGMIGSGFVGAGIGWAASALTLLGRVEAIETGFERLEKLLLDHLQRIEQGAKP